MSVLSDHVSYYMHLIYLWESGNMPMFMIGLTQLAPSGTHTQCALSSDRILIVRSKGHKDHIKATETPPSGRSKELCGKVHQEHKQLLALEACHAEYRKLADIDKALLLDFGRYRCRGKRLDKKSYARLHKTINKFNPIVSDVINAPELSAATL